MAQLLERPPCPNGCPPDDRVLFESPDVNFGHEGVFGLVQCRNCGLIRTSPRPAKSRIAYYYSGAYTPYQEGEPAPAPDGDGGPLSRLAAAYRARSSGLLLPDDLEPGSLLEIGCSHGALLDRMRSRGWRTQGIEMHQPSAEKARAKGHPVIVADVEAMAMPETGPYDLIVASHVVEHLFEPVATLGKLADWTRPGGVFVMALPNAAAWGWRRLRQFWQPVDVPRHLFHYDPTTLTRMLARGGWRVRRIVPQYSSTFLLYSVANWLAHRGREGQASRCREIAENRRQRLLRRLLGLALGLSGQSGCMICVAERQ